VSHKNYWMCSDEANVERSQTLKKYLDDHFEDNDADDMARVTDDNDVITKEVCDVLVIVVVVCLYVLFCFVIVSRWSAMMMIMMVVMEMIVVIVAIIHEQR